MKLNVGVTFLNLMVQEKLIEAHVFLVKQSKTSIIETLQRSNNITI